MSVSPWLGHAGCPVVPVSSEDLPTSTRLRARVRFEVGDRVFGLEIIASKGPEDLVVVGLAPHGTRLFAVRQRGRDIAIDTASSGEIKRVALWVMDALHRGLWIDLAATDSRRQDGTSWSWEGEQVVEAQHDGRWRREFRRAGDTRDVAPVSIDYRDAPHRRGSGFEIRNAWCGYEAVIIPLDEAD